MGTHYVSIHAKPNEFSNAVAKHAKAMLQDYFKGFDINLKCIDVQHSTHPERKFELKVAKKRNTGIKSFKASWKSLRQLDTKVKKIIFFNILVYLSIHGATLKSMRLTKRQFMVFAVGFLFQWLPSILMNDWIASAIMHDDGI